ncbi:MAG: pyridoxamine 5'-phosphate oxidase [Candidatus Hydrogenedens sp.]|nr:pyridoxamine 5'-phosphate oxidase [Candidatus Hydrogenedens sp.]
MAIPDEKNPVDLFRTWFAEADAHAGIPQATAMSLATVDEHGRPDVRIVLLKSAGDDGFVFYTNLGSTKAHQLTVNPHAALCFHYAPQTRQIRVRGSVTPVTPDEADAYFASRPKQSQLGAWASKQSQALEGRFELERRLAHFTAQYGLGAVPRPEFWSGFRLVPWRIEFWLEQPYRLHDRVEYTRNEDGTGEWERRRLFP